MVDAIANGVEDLLVDGLSFKLPSSATYVTDRKSVTFHASGSNEYSSSGVKLINVAVNGTDWMDPSTLRVAFDLVNTNAVAGALLRPLSGGWSFFRRLRILAQGTVVEDITEYNRCHQMFSTLISKNSKANVDAEAFGLSPWDYKTELLTENFPGIKGGGQTQTIIFTPLSGLLSQSKYLPLKYCNLVFELELVSDNTLPFVLNSISPFTTTNTSNSWKIQNVQIKVDTCTLDNQLDNQYTEVLLSGKSLPINYSTYISQFQSIMGGDANGQQKVRINISRSLSRLTSVFVTFDKTIVSPVYKDFNNFYSPSMSDDNDQIIGSTNAVELEFQIRLANKLYPEYPLRSHQEGFYQLRKTLGIQSSALHSFDISAQEYKRHKFILELIRKIYCPLPLMGKALKAVKCLIFALIMEQTQ